MSKGFPSKFWAAAKLNESKQQHYLSQRILSKGEIMGVQKLGITVVPGQDPTQIHTSDWLKRSSDHFCHRGHLSLSSKVVSLEVQQHCSWLYQKADRQTPSFRSVIQSTARSMTPAKVPRKRKNHGEELPHGKKTGHSQSWVNTQATATKTDSCFHSPGSHLSIYGMSQSVGIPKSHKGPRASNQVAGLCGSILLSCEGRWKFRI